MERDETASEGAERSEEWVELGPLDAFPEGQAVLKKTGGQRFACVRRGLEVHALDDRCPHQGYPLSQGDLAGDVLTCAWHNWKFEVATGACTFGGEAVKRYPVRIEGGRVHLDRAIDVPAERARLARGIRAALLDDDIGRALRESLRLGATATNETKLGELAEGFAMVAADGAARAEYGFDHGLALLTDATTWAERGLIGRDQAFTLAAHAVAEASRRLAPRAVPSASEFDAPSDTARVVEALVGERRGEAEARARVIAEQDGADAATRALVPFVARHIYDYGHGAIFLSKARELSLRFPEARAAIFGASALELAWATADTALPPFAATRAALERVDALGHVETRDIAWDRRAFESATLEGEKHAVVRALELLGAGVAPMELLRAVAHAAATRVFRFDGAWERRLDAEVNVLDVTHAVTFTEAAISLLPFASPADRARLVVLAAGFVGKLRRADRDDGGPSKSIGGDLASALERRDVSAALGAVHGLDKRGRAQAFEAMAPFCALDAAVRPIFYAHCVKNAEALRRLDEADPEADGMYLDALLAFVTPIRPENRARRTASVATKFMQDGRPPEGLY